MKAVAQRDSLRSRRMVTNTFSPDHPRTAVYAVSPPEPKPI